MLFLVRESPSVVATLPRHRRFKASHLRSIQIKARQSKNPYPDYGQKPEEAQKDQKNTGGDANPSSLGIAQPSDRAGGTSFSRRSKARSSSSRPRAFSDRNESVGIPKTARVRFKLDAGEGGQHA
jgi:hypothetical protein